MARRTARWSGARPAATGAVLGACAAGMLHGGLDADDARLGLALFLALTAASYPGALLAAQGRLGDRVGELLIGIAVFACAVAGGLGSTAWLAGGYALHAGWDWLHHTGHVRTRVLRWFPPACAGFDAAAALVILLLIG